jgi:enoyl-[acyl-carrier protein] reductase II
MLLPLGSSRVTKLFGVELPIVQAGMVWCSGWRLASAVSEAGGLGLIGSSSMTPDILREHIRKAKLATTKPFGVNVPLLYHGSDEIIKVIIEEKVGIVFTAAGSPKKYTSLLQSHGIIVAHVTASSEFAKKAEDAGCNAVVAEGFEAGGHNGREETTTLVLIPLVRKAVNIPVIAAGGIASGSQVLAALVLGADGVQIGSRFIATIESSAHQAFKEKIVSLPEGGTLLTMKKTTPVRLIRNEFFTLVKEAEDRGATKEELLILLGKGKAKLGMFDGDLENGELEVGQGSSLIEGVKTAKQVIEDIWKELTGKWNALKPT